MNKKSTITIPWKIWKPTEVWKGIDYYLHVLNWSLGEVTLTSEVRQNWGKGKVKYSKTHSCNHSYLRVNLDPLAASKPAQPPQWVLPYKEVHKSSCISIWSRKAQLTQAMRASLFTAPQSLSALSRAGVSLGQCPLWDEQQTQGPE